MLNLILDFFSMLLDLMGALPPVSLLRFVDTFAIESVSAFILGILIYLVFRPIVENILGKYLSRSER